MRGKINTTHWMVARSIANDSSDSVKRIVPMFRYPVVSRRSILGTSLHSLTIPLLSGTGLVGISACRAETPKERALVADTPPDDHRTLQSMLNKGGIITLDRTYSVADTLYVSGNTHVRGINNARIVWTGPTNRSIIRDTSTRTSSIRNRNIILENFEIDGGDLATGGADQFAIEFYRTGNVILRRLIIHGIGGSGVRWGNSYLDTTDILVENCTIFDCRLGDALQGSGRRITLRNNNIGTQFSRNNFGDTGIALLMDFDRISNPEGLYSSQVHIIGNHIRGNHPSFNNSRIFNKAQTGIACGPFNTSFPSFINIERNHIEDCYVNIWISSMRKIIISDNFLEPHYSNLTGNVRLDNVSDTEIYLNKIYITHLADTNESSAITIQSRRSIYGKSVFDGDVSNINIFSNTIFGYKSSGIRFEFGEKNTNPPHISKIDAVHINGNFFIGIRYPVIVAPVTGETPDTFSYLSVTNNSSDIDTETFITFLGRKSQYRKIVIHQNEIPNRSTLMSGTGTSVE
ncbi:right-handed parallel beta-helix repeat-containing protein [Sphingomonas sp. SAFR-052]|uniref:right-handed parallel beta-helix repeat-containing protein n=1 Tax=Sphingomonas sp. SAFR-052 TaxID=3436867 RepID=UPI003F7DCB29